MTALPNAPLAYFVGMARFPKVPNIGDRFVPLLHELLRSHYPLPDDAVLHGYQASAAASDDMHPERTETKIWQWMDLAKTSAFMLGDEFLALHTIAYCGHEIFTADFRAGWQQLMGIPAIGIELVSSIGIRYVDLIRPRPGEHIESYLAPNLVPVDAEAAGQSLSLLGGAAVGAYKTDNSFLRYQVVHDARNTIPHDLDTPFISRNGWKPSRPKQGFAVLDIDHGRRFDPPAPTLDIDIEEAFVGLRNGANALLHALATEFAFKVWREEP